LSDATARRKLIGGIGADTDEKVSWLNKEVSLSQALCEKSLT
jgi:hypothetical protein